MIFWATVAALYGLFAAIAWINPPQGDDWRHLAWAARHKGALWPAILGGARVTGELVGPVLALCKPVHVLVTPAVMVALLVAMVAHARGRWPEPRKDGVGDAFLLLAALGVLRMATPGFGMIISHRPFVAVYLYGLTAMLWLLAAYRFARPDARATLVATLAMLLLGLLAGASRRPAATVGAVILVLLLRARARRGERLPAWMWTGALGVAIGLVAVWLEEPRADFGRLWITRIDANLNVLYEYVGQNGHAVTVLALVLLALLVRERWRGRPVPTPGLAQLGAIRWILLAWAGMAVVGLVGPVWIAPVKLGAAAVLSIAVLAVLAAVFDASAGDSWLRGGLWLLVLVPVLELLVAGMPRWLDQRAQHERRIRALAGAPAGSVVTIAPGAPVAGDFWVAPEGWFRASLREQVARNVYGLADIRFSTPFRDLEPSMNLDFGARGVARDLSLAKREFRAAPHGELLVTSIDWPERRGRPLVAARMAADGTLVIPEGHHGGPITNGRFWVRPDAPVAAGAEVWLVNDGHALSVTQLRGRFELLPPQGGWYLLAVCDAAECWAVDAFYVRP